MHLLSSDRWKVQKFLKMLIKIQNKALISFNVFQEIKKRMMIKKFKRL
jgi:hypothetical protein